PGIYREGSHGVRHENMLLCVEAGKNEFDDWLCFETLTMVYFDTTPLLTEFLSNSEIRWINNYNKSVAETLLPFMNEKEAVWLKRKTKAI
ncbi:MAG TPA: M24 family metallopeptidase C-terminal domain-containing protein, partial [Bacteroidaceae bacterium]|nr:M24 family metallopeptidase C-terminal domain-containing protein [Bacteroidaceae bacterium]